MGKPQQIQKCPECDEGWLSVVGLCTLLVLGLALLALVGASLHRGWTSYGKINDLARRMAEQNSELEYDVQGQLRRMREERPALLIPDGAKVAIDGGVIVGGQLVVNGELEMGDSIRAEGITVGVGGSVRAGRPATVTENGFCVGEPEFCRGGKK